MGVLKGKDVALPETSLAELWCQTARLRKKQTAVIYDGQSLSYGDIEIQSCCLAQKLQRLIGDKDTRQADPVIVLYVPPSQSRIVCLVAAVRVQIAYVPLDTALPRERVLHILEETRPAAILTVTNPEDREHAFMVEEVARDTGIQIMNCETAFNGDMVFENKCDMKPCEYGIASDKYQMKQDEQQREFQLPPIAKFLENTNNPLVCVIYTSGSTGQPKGVRLRQQNILNRLFWFWNEFPIEEEAVACHKTSILFVDSLTEILGNILVGIPLLILRKRDVTNPATFVSAIDTYSVSRLVLVPSLLQSLVALCCDKETALASLRLVVSSGEALSPRLAQSALGILPRNCRLANFYGSTEVTGDVTCTVFDNVRDVELSTIGGQLSVGRPVYNTWVHILDDQLRTVDNGHEGEMYISGLNVAEGHDKDDVGSFAANPDQLNKNHLLLYKTGDFAFIHNKEIIYTGRAGNIAKVRGHRVNVSEIETVIRGIPQVAMVVVLPCKTTFGNDESPDIVAFYESQREMQKRSNAHQSDTLRELILQTCRSQLPAYAVPVLRQVDSLPLQASTGKVDRRYLQRMYSDAGNTDCNLEADDLGLEVQQRLVLSSIARALNLGIREVYNHQTHTFYSLGGNSLSAVSVVLCLRSNGIELEFDQLDKVPISDILAIARPRLDVMTISRLSCDLEHVKTKYDICPLSGFHDYYTVQNLTAEAFVHKNPIDVVAGTSADEFLRLLRSIWDVLLQDDASFVVTERASSSVVAVTFMVDIRSEMEPDFAKEEVGAVNDCVEEPVRTRLLETGEHWMDSILAAVDISLPPNDNVAIVCLMEDEIIRMGKERGWKGIVTVNSHPVTMEIAEHVFGYQVENVLKVKTFQFRGTTPFAAANDHYVIKCMTKVFNRN